MITIRDPMAFAEESRRATGPPNPEPELIRRIPMPAIFIVKSLQTWFIRTSRQSTNDERD
jgi:hypothetical protein